MGVIEYLNSLPLDTVIAGNSLLVYFYAICSFLVLSGVFFVLRVRVLASVIRWSKRTTNIYDDLVVTMLSSIKCPTYFFISLYISVDLFLEVSSAVDIAFLILLNLFIINLVVKVFSLVSEFVFDTVSMRVSSDYSGFLGATKSLGNIAKIIIWLFGLLILLSNLGIDVTALLAGLGIGGLAFAFAFQRILADLFSAFVIFTDNPFTVGDVIVFGTTSGTVERIGLKTSTLRSYDGEEIVVPNDQLTSSVVQNFSRLQERRSVIDINLTYDTTHAQLSKIPEMLKMVVERIEGVTFGRAHLRKFGDSALVFQLVYYVSSANYTVYCDREQEVLLDVLAEFDKHKIEIAFPTRTVHLHKS